ncbi:MAG: nucleoside triphosphate pyrophosphohydrolase [Rhizorhabdus sp.]|nr:nucleoside triphosphate pyrophosphohydrolase [Rhizorhabdus sp.]
MIEKLRDIMARLRDPEQGCPWDVAQDFGTIAPYTIEEAYEVADAIERGDLDALRDELGDLQLQVVFHARMAEEAGAFTLGDVLDSICAKMIRRHPHVFGDGASPGWEEIKAEERTAHADGSALAGVAMALPALLRAEKLQKRAARTGFDWPDDQGVRAKIHEEIDEVAAATSPAEHADEIGDLLFAVVNWARHLGVDPEAALRGANAKFERRFRAMEDIAGETFAGLALDAKEELWQQAKRAERAKLLP